MSSLQNLKTKNPSQSSTTLTNSISNSFFSKFQRVQFWFRSALQISSETNSIPFQNVLQQARSSMLRTFNVLLRSSSQLLWNVASECLLPGPELLSCSCLLPWTSLLSGPDLLPVWFVSNTNLLDSSQMLQASDLRSSRPHWSLLARHAVRLEPRML